VIDKHEFKLLESVKRVSTGVEISELWKMY
jgi:hypothetical protein